MKLLAVICILLLASVEQIPILRTQNVKIVAKGSPFQIPNKRNKKLKGWQKN